MKSALILCTSFILTWGALNFKSIYSYVFKPTPKSSIYSDPRTLPFYLNCSNPREAQLELASHLVVHQDFVKKFDLQRHPEVAVKEQLKYLRGFFHFSPDFTSLPHLTEEIEVQKVEVVNYDREILFDFEGHDPAIFPGSFKKGRLIKSDEKAVKINYKAVVPITTCFKKNPEDDFKVILPIDPYLAYWDVSPEDRVEVSQYGSTVVANPCVSDRYAVLNYAPHYWYTYRPERKDELKGYDCQELLKKGRDVVAAAFEFKWKEVQKTPFNFEEISKLKSYSISAIFGLIDYDKTSQEALEEIRKVFASDQNLKVILQEKHLFKSKMRELREKKLDPSVMAYVSFLYNLTELVDLKSINFDHRDGFSVSNISGVFKNNKKEVDFNFFIGPTSGQGPHWNFLKERFQKDDFLFYIAHAGHGEFASLDKMTSILGMNNQSIEETFNKKPYQFFGIISCFSSAYHGQEYFTYRKAPDLTSDLMLMGSDGYSFLAPFVVIGLIDGLDYDALIKNYVRPEDVLIIKRVSH